MVRYDRGHFFYLKCGCMMMSVNQRDGSVIDKKESLFPRGRGSCPSKGRLMRVGGLRT